MPFIPTRLQHMLIAVLLFGSVLLIYLRSPNTHLSDSLWAIHISSSLINTGNSDLDEYANLINDGETYAVLPNNNDHFLPLFPVGNSILAIPIIWVIEQTIHLSEHDTFYEYLQQTSPKDPDVVAIQHLSASIITALIAPLLYFIGRELVDGITIPVLGAYLFAFGTSAFSIASRVLWQHGPTMLLLTISLYLFIKANSQPRYIQLAGLPLALAYVVRPTNSLSILVLTAVVFLKYRKQLPGYLFSAALVAIPFFWANIATYGHLLAPYYWPQRLGSSPYFAEALIGNLISPGRGLFIYSPVLLFAFYGMYMKWKQAKFTVLDTAVIVIIISHWVVISSFRHWWGGDSYGPRLFSDVTPYFFYFLLLGIYPVQKPVYIRPIRTGVFAICATISIAIHYIGANQAGIINWYTLPVVLDSHAETRLWDWSDLQFFRTVDDWPLVTNPFVQFDQAANHINDLLHIPIHNRTDTSYSWEVKVPSSLQLAEITGIDHVDTATDKPLFIGTAPLPAHDYQWLPLVLDTPLNTRNDYSLGAIKLTTRNHQGTIVTSQIIPVSIVNNGQYWPDSFAISSDVWLPTDITVNNNKPNSQIYALYGTGWYQLESWEQHHWRWAQSPAELYIFSADTQQVTLNLNFTALHDNNLDETGRLHLTTESQNLVEQVSSAQTQPITIRLEKGWNTVVFALESGNFRPTDEDTTSSDQRLLSFSLESLDIVTGNK